VTDKPTRPGDDGAWNSLLDRRLLRADDWTGRWEREEEKVRQKRVDFGGDKIDDELDWAAGCKGCGELYVLREVGAEETTFTVAQHQHALSQRAYGRVVSVIRDRYGTLLQNLRA
jgi:hypothetical protein